MSDEDISLNVPAGLGLDDVESADGELNLSREFGEALEEGGSIAPLEVEADQSPAGGGRTETLEQVTRV